MIHMSIFKSIILCGCVFILSACGGDSSDGSSNSRNPSNEESIPVTETPEETPKETGRPSAGCSFSMDCFEQDIEPISNKTSDDSLTGVWLVVGTDHKERSKIDKIEIFTIVQSANVITSYACSENSREQDVTSRTPFSTTTLASEIDGKLILDADESFSNIIYKEGIFSNNKEFSSKRRDDIYPTAQAFKISDTPFSVIGYSDESNPLYCLTYYLTDYDFSVISEDSSDFEYQSVKTNVEYFYRNSEGSRTARNYILANASSNDFEINAENLFRYSGQYSIGGVPHSFYVDVSGF